MALQVVEDEMSEMLDVMANHLLAHEEIEFSDCILDWYRNEFPCDLVPMPGDHDEVRLAVKASIMDRLVEVLNSPPHNANQIAPEWCGRIKALRAPLRLQSDRLLEDEIYCEAFAKRNLFAVKNFMYFI
ncbi:MAG: hypothetical protein RL748_1704 [Pseudomonadota bacterium]|jgi:hypothetical protein